MPINDRVLENKRILIKVCSKQRFEMSQKMMPELLPQSLSSDAVTLKIHI